MSDRFVLIALARPRATWLDRFVQIAHSGAIPVEVRKAVGVVDLLAQLASGRPASAVLLDAGAPGTDRDIISRVHSSGAAVFVVTDPQVVHDWTALGADVMLTPAFTAYELLDALTHSARSIARSTFPDEAAEIESLNDATSRHGAFIGVLGAGGTGTSTVAIAAAQGLGSGAGRTGQVALVDLCLRAEQSMLHDADPSSPGILELIDYCRLGSPDPDTVREHLTVIHKRGYDLLPGLRRRRLWTQLRPASTCSALSALRRAYDVVVADLDSDLEGEVQSGSMDLEERNQLTRLAVTQTDVTLVVGHASMKGIHSLTRLLRDLVDLGVAPSTLQPVFNHAPASPRSRSGYTAALGELTAGVGLSSTPIFLPTKDIDDRLRALVPFPASIVEPIAGALMARLKLQTMAPASAAQTTPRVIRPGFLRRDAQAS